MPNTDNQEKLRREAEARLQAISELSEVPSMEEVRTLVHELRVHQIELEMQNHELREAQHRLEESRDKYTDLFEFAPVGDFILDKNGLILNCNLTGSGMLGLERSQLIQKPFVLFLGNGAEEASLFRRHLKRAFDNENMESCELQLKRNNSSDFTARLDNLKMMDDHGQFTQIRMTIMDITKEKKAENMKSMLEAVLHGQESERERIAAELHDSINPLLSIASLNIESLLDYYKKNHDLPTVKLDSTISILKNAIREIKEISSNLSPVVLKNFGLSTALKQLFKKINETGQIQLDFLEYGIEERLDPKFELALYRIAQELLNNILKHADANHVTVQIIRHRDSIVMMVSDDGVGFDVSTEKIKTNGFGFKNITSRVQALNGQLDIDSSKNKGTTVTIELPM